MVSDSHSVDSRKARLGSHRVGLLETLGDIIELLSEKEIIGIRIFKVAVMRSNWSYFEELPRKRAFCPSLCSVCCCVVFIGRPACDSHAASSQQFGHSVLDDDILKISASPQKNLEHEDRSLEVLLLHEEAENDMWKIRCYLSQYPQITAGISHNYSV